jgi:diguanylate cyclase
VSTELLSLFEQAQPFKGFRNAAYHVLKFLHSRLGFSLWMVTRVEGNDWIVLTAEDHGYNLEDGAILRWSDSFCIHMVQGKGPQIAPRSRDILAYAQAPINQQIEIAAYIGIPLRWPNGDFFGTLCAIDPRPQPEEICLELPLLELMGQLLSYLIAAELNSQEMSRCLHQAHREAQVDSLTGLYNRRGWELFLQVEEAHCQTLGSLALVVVIDLDNLKQINDCYGHTYGDALIRQAALCLQHSVRTTDLVARLGGDEFAILVVELKAMNVAERVNSIQAALQSRGIAASVGWALRSHTMSLADTLQKADEQMYRCKRQRKAASYK